MKNIVIDKDSDNHKHVGIRVYVLEIIKIKTEVTIDSKIYFREKLANKFFEETAKSVDTNIFRVRYYKDTMWLW